MDIDKLLSPISPDLPCGADLQDHEDYLRLERDIEGTPEKQIGNQTVAAQEPNWKNLVKTITKLCTQTKDLNLAVMLTRALLNSRGLQGFEEGLHYVNGLLQQFWQDVHPQLESADELPIRRINIIRNLVDNLSILAPLRETRLVENKVGKFTLRDYHIATGNIVPRNEEERPDIKLINAAFTDEDIGKLQQNAQTVQSILQLIQELDARINEILGEHRDQGVSFAQLVDLMREIHTIYSEQLRLRGVASGGAGNGDSVQDAPNPQGGDAIVGTINSREDVVRVLDLASDYFRRNEPSSPVPLLLQRAKHLLSKDFMEILRDLAPDAVKQAELIGGVQEKD